MTIEPQFNVPFSKNGMMTLETYQMLKSIYEDVVAGGSGASAYEVAVANGFVGTEADWLASLAGSDGADSTVPGPQGVQGIQGIQGIQGNPGADGVTTSHDVYESTDSFNSYILGEDISGDTSVALGECKVYRNLIGDVGAFSLGMVVDAFSQNVDDDSIVEFHFDLAQLMADQGWSKPNFINLAFGSATVNFMRSGADYPYTPFYCEVRPTGTYPGSVYFRSHDRVYYADTGLATSFYLSAHFTTRCVD